jgi:hypothetical protein
MLQRTSNNLNIIYVGVPVWTPHNRGNETDAFPQRVDYVTKVLKSGTSQH